MATNAKITRIQERTDIGVTGQVIPVYEIYFTSAKGATGTMRFHKADFDEVEARAAVEKEAARLDTLFG